MQQNQKVEIDRRTQASKFLKDLDELRVFDNRLVSLRRIPTAFFLPPPKEELVWSKLYKRNDDLYIPAGECRVGITSPMVLGKENCT